MRRSDLPRPVRDIADPSLDERWIWRLVGPPKDEIAVDLRSRGLIPVAPQAIARETFVLAARHLATVPTLESRLSSLVRTVTILSAAPEYDVSHSEPRWPGAIFVSSPPPGTVSASMRLLESIVHEGMHLQLTQLEERQPQVLKGARRQFSPWKNEERDAQGVLHGVYVFTCIAALLAEPPLLNILPADDIAYAARRRIEIASELENVDMRSLAERLSHEGRALLARLSSPTGPPPWILSFA